MTASIFVMVLQICIKFLPILYQLKFIRDEATLKELQRRFESAVRKAEEGALDSVRLREQHRTNEERLRARWDTIRAGEPDPALPTVPASPLPAPEALLLKAPERAKARTAFVVELSRPVPKADLFADEWRLFTLGEQTRVEVNLNTPGVRTLQVKFEGKILAQVTVQVEA